MAKVLIVSSRRNLSQVGREAQVLQNLGIQTTLAVLNGTGTSAFETPVSALDPTSADARAYLRQFDAVFVIERSAHLGDGTSTIDASLAWLNWNDPEDPPIVYFGTMFSAIRSQATAFLPSDFPIVRPNASDLANTATMLDAGTTWERPIRIGTRIRLLRENALVYIPSVNWRTLSEESGFWRLNLAQHSALGSNGEILAVPDQPDVSYSADTMVAYRYRKHFLLPMVYLFSSTSLVVRTPDVPYAGSYGVFWLLYALKLCGVRPAWRVPIHFETDHPLQLGDTRVDGMNFVEQLTIQRDTLDWLVGFCERTGLVVFHGVQIGGRDRTRTSFPPAYDHWVLLNRPDVVGSDAVQVAQQAHSILVANHTKTQPCGPHDHTMPGSGLNQSGSPFTLKRHSGGQYGAPNDVPIGHGIAVNKRYAPVTFTGLEYTLDGQEWIETAMPMSGVGTSVPNARDGSYHLARIVVEGHIDEMRAMGFADGYGGDHRYTNTAKNSSGSPGYWQAYRDAGYRGIRSSLMLNGRNAITTASRFWNGFQLLVPLSVDALDSSQGSYGLYHPTAPSGAHAVGVYNLDIGGDIADNYPATAWKAYRRVVSYSLTQWLQTSVGQLGAAYLHPVTCFGASPSHPTARFSEFVPNLSGLPAYNHFVELLCEMEPIVQVLSDYLYFGSVSDLFAVRERVLA